MSKQTENTASHATAGRRLEAAIIDAIVIQMSFLLIIILYVLFFLLQGMGADIFHMFGMMILIVFTSIPVVKISAGLIIEFFYCYFFYSSKRQATIGMRCLNIKLTNAECKKPSKKQIVLRYLLYSIIPLIAFGILMIAGMDNTGDLPSVKMDGIKNALIFYISATVLNFLMITFTKHKQTYYDMISKTYVVNSSQE